MRDCLKKGLKIIAVEEKIAKLTEDRDSTWFTGFDEKYYYDKGALYFTISRFFFPINALQFSIRKSKFSNGKISKFSVFKLMIKGALSVKEKKPYYRTNEEV